MEKFPNLLPQLGMYLEVGDPVKETGTLLITVWEGERIVCLGVGSDVQDALRRAEPYFWEFMVDRKLSELLAPE